MRGTDCKSECCKLALLSALVFSLPYVSVFLNFPNRYYGTPFT